MTEEPEEALEPPEEEEALTPAADGIMSTKEPSPPPAPPVDHEQEEAEQVQEADIEEIIEPKAEQVEDNFSPEEDIKAAVADHEVVDEPALEAANVRTEDVCLAAQPLQPAEPTLQLEQTLDNCAAVVGEAVACVAAVEEKPVELRLEMPPAEPLPTFQVPETPKSYMDDGEEVREQRPGFQDLGNCKRFWKAQQMIGTRKAGRFMYNGGQECATMAKGRRRFFFSPFPPLLCNKPERD